MKRLTALLGRMRLPYIIATAVLLLLTASYTYKLGTIPNGLSQTEITAATDPVGWHGIYDEPFYLPVKALRSIIFFLQPEHGQLLTRLASVPFGIVSIACFYIITRWWYGQRIAVYSGVLFAASAWSLHVSRFAGAEVMYFAAIPVLLLSHVALQRFKNNPRILSLSIVAWLLLLYVPGLIWFIIPSVILQRRFILDSLHEMSTRLKLINAFGTLLFVPLLFRHFLRPDAFPTWIGLPMQWGTPLHIAKEVVAVPVHLFIRGPQYPELWLGKAPILDIFCLALALIGFYFFATRFDAYRSRLLIGTLLLGTLIVGIEGPVSISLLVPLLFLFVATGLAYLLKEWLSVFPNNPVPRFLGIGLIIAAITMSVVYNTRSYFIAWPHAPATEATFRYHR